MLNGPSQRSVRVSHRCRGPSSGQKNAPLMAGHHAAGLRLSSSRADSLPRPMPRTQWQTAPRRPTPCSISSCLLRCLIARLATTTLNLSTVSVNRFLLQLCGAVHRVPQRVGLTHPCVGRSHQAVEFELHGSSRTRESRSLIQQIMASATLARRSGGLPCCVRSSGWCCAESQQVHRHRTAHNSRVHKGWRCSRR